MNSNTVTLDTRRPDNNIIQVSFRREVKFWEYLTKVYFQHFDQVELVAKGRAIYLAVRAAKVLNQKELASYIKIETFISSENSQDQKKKNLMIKPSIKIILKKDPNFELKMQMLKLVKNPQDIEQQQKQQMDQNYQQDESDEEEDDTEDEKDSNDDQLNQPQFIVQIFC